MEIYLYTEPGCRACVDAKTFLTLHGISFQERDVRNNPKYLRILNHKLDSCTTPTLVVEQDIIVGFDRLKYQLLARTLGSARPIPSAARPARRATLMKLNRVVIVFMFLAWVLPLRAQMAFGPRMPDMSGIWHPVVGTGGAYEITDSDGKKSQMEITVVGKEDVQGKPGYWLEIAMASPRTGGDMFMKYLVAPGDAGMNATKMVMQQPGQDPMEMDLNMMGMGGRKPAMPTPSDIRDKADHVGTETITVPAGTFSCEHYRAKDGSSDVWVSDKVGPWGLVKMQGKNNAMILNKVVTDAKDHITGTPKTFDPMQMMRNGGGKQ